MIKQFSKKGYKEIKRLLEKLEKKKVSLHEQEDFLILEKERNLALERRLAEEAAMVEQLTTDLSLANNSNKRMSKDYTLAIESLASLKATTSTNAIIYDHYLVTISCLVIEVLFAVTKKYLVIEDYSFYDDIQIW
jgi:hypothetical protein